MQSRRDDSVIKVLWIGGLGNAEYLTSVLSVIKDLSKTFSVKLIVVGGEDIYDLDIEDDICEKRIWNMGVEQEVLRQCHIGIMPLVNKDFELGKCAFKLIQYFSAALPVVASPVGMNVDVVETNVNGFLADSDSEWMDALHRLVSDASLRETLGVNAHSSYQKQFSPESQLSNWMKVINQKGS